MTKIISFIKEHKFKLLILAVIMIAGFYYWQIKVKPKAVKLTYVTEAATKTSIVVSVNGSGQVSESNKIDVKPLGSGAVTSVRVKAGTKVKADQLIATLDQRDNSIAIRQAQASLASAKASYQKTVDGVTAQDITISQNSIDQAYRNYLNSQTSLENTQESTASTVKQAQDALNDLLNTSEPTGKRAAVLNTLDDKLNVLQSALDAVDKLLTDENAKATLSVQNSSALNSAKNSYGTAESLLIKANASYNQANNNTTDVNLSLAVNDAIGALSETTKCLSYAYQVAQATVSSQTLSQSQIDNYRSNMSSQQSSITSGISTIITANQTLRDALVSAQNTLNSAQLSAKSQIASSQNQVTSAQNNWENAKQSHAKLITPVSDNDLASAKAQILNAEIQMQNAQNNFQNNIIKAPFDGIIASVTAQVGDQAGASSIIATLISPQKIAIIPLNEVDIAKIKLGQNATMTFSAVTDLTLTGTVAEIDTLGTETQGVVTYNVKINFDTDDDRVKPGMSVDTAIITDSKTDVIAIPSSAVKTNKGTYVQTLDANGQPQNITVTTGITNDTLVEIISGVNENDQVITQTIGASTTNTTPSAGLRIPGLTGTNRGAGALR